MDKDGIDTSVNSTKNSNDSTNQGLSVGKIIYFNFEKEKNDEKKNIKWISPAATFVSALAALLSSYFAYQTINSSIQSSSPYITITDYRIEKDKEDKLSFCLTLGNTGNRPIHKLDIQSAFVSTSTKINMAAALNEVPYSIPPQEKTFSGHCTSIKDLILPGQDNRIFFVAVIKGEDFFFKKDLLPQKVWLKFDIPNNFSGPLTAQFLTPSEIKMIKAEIVNSPYTPTSTKNTIQED